MGVEGWSTWLSQAAVRNIVSKPTTGVPPRLEVLTQRELDVFRLLARGCTNPDIADQLYLGEATVKTHLGHILTKLDLRDRTQAIILAYETGLIQPGDEN